MIRTSLFFTLLVLSQPIGAQDPCDPPLIAFITSNGPVCAGNSVELVFTLPDDDDFEGFEVTYSIGGNTFTLTGAISGATVSHVVTMSTTATLLQVINNDDDDDNCFTTFNQTISIQVFAPAVTITSQTNPTCGLSNGSLTALASNGSSPYQYSLNNGPFQNSGTFSNLPAGNYTVLTQDAAGCTASISTDLSSGNAPNLSITSQISPTCGQSNGSLTALASNGSSPYQYSLNNGPFQNSGTFSNLPAGNYTVLTQDAAGCTASVSTDLSSGNAPSISISSQINPSCGQFNGSLTALASNGSSPFQYSLNNGPFQNSGTFSNLPAGNYTVLTQDAAGCTASISTDLSSGNAPSISISSQINPSCGQSNGSLTALASNGSLPYQYSLNNGPFQNSGTFSNLPAGNYTVLTQDAAGCTASVSTDLSSGNAPTLNILSQSNPSCGETNGTITASASGGTGNYQFSLGGTVYQDSPFFNNLGPGLYSVYVRDAAGCIDIESITLNNPGSNLPMAVITANQTQGCTSTTFSLAGNLPAGATGLWTSDEVLPPTPSNPLWILDNASVGNVVVTWTLSVPGCPNYDEATLILNILPPPDAAADGVIDVLQGENNTLNVMVNDVVAAPVEVRILQNPTQGVATFNAQNNLEYQPYANATGLDTVVYEICYIQCSTVCDTAPVFFRNVRKDDPCVITGDTSNVFTNGLTPNGDGLNDKLIFRVVSVEDCTLNYGKSEIIIYNRWGDIVFEASPYDNDWEGRRNGKDLPPGVYYFVLRVSLEKVYTQFGSVILLR